MKARKKEEARKKKAKAAAAKKKKKGRTGSFAMKSPAVVAPPKALVKTVSAQSGASTSAQKKEP